MNNGYNNNNPFDENPFDEDKNDYLFQTVTGRGRKKTYSWSLAAFVCGILALVFSCLIYAGLICGVLAIVFAAISRKNLGFFDRMSVTAIILGIISVVIGVALLVTIMTMSEEDMQKIIDTIYQAEQSQTQTPEL